MTSTTRALFLVVVVAGAAGAVAGSFVGEAGDGGSSLPTRRHTPRPRAPTVATPSTTTGEAYRPATKPIAARGSQAAVGTSSDRARADQRRVIANGLVVDTAGAPIAGATVEGRETSVETNIDGSFRIDVLPHASLSIRAPGFVTSWAWVPDDDDPDSSLRPVVLPHAATVRGIVTCQQRPVSGARVRFARQGRCRIARHETTTDDEGRFELTGRTEGRDSVSAIVEVDGTPRWCSATHEVLLGEGATVELALALIEVHCDLDVTVRTADGGTPHGRSSPQVSVVVGSELIVEAGPVWAPTEAEFDVVARQGALIGRAHAAAGQRRLDVNLEPGIELRGCVRWPTGVPAAGAIVQYEAAGRHGSFAFTKTDDGGCFTVTVPRDLGGRLSIWDGHLSVDTVVAARQTTIDVTLPRTGMVRAMVTPRTLVTHITAAWEDGGRLLEDGVAEQVAAGRVQVVARDLGLGLHGAAWVDVAADATTDMQLALSPAARVRGRVIDPRGRAVNVELRLADERASTDALGRFCFDVVPLGQHTLGAAGDLALVAARFHARRATLRDRIIDITRAEELDLGDLVVEVE